MNAVKEVLNHIAAETGDSLRAIALSTGVSAGHLSKLSAKQPHERLTARVAHSLCVNYDVPTDLTVAMFQQLTTDYSGDARRFIVAAMTAAAIEPEGSLSDLFDAMAEVLSAHD